MAFPRKHLLLIASLLIGVICISLYIFLLRPVMVKRQDVEKKIGEGKDKLKKYSKDPPSPEGVSRGNREKELLERQYENVIGDLDFLPRRSLPEKIGLWHLYFEEQLERAEDELNRLGKKTGIQIPARLGFKMEKPESREELAVLLSQVDAAKELITLIIGGGVRHISSINPLPLAEDRFVKVPDKSLLEELDIELSLRSEVSTLTELLYRLSTCPHFFTVEDVELKSVSVKRDTAPSREETRHRGGRVRGREEVVTRELVTGESIQKETAVELEAKILISTQLLLEEKK